MDKHMTELEREIRRVSDDRDQQISRAMAVLIVMLTIGPNADHLAQHTGYPREFVAAALIEHTEEAGLWTNGLLDDREWWYSNGELNGVAVFYTCARGTRTCSKRNDAEWCTLFGPSDGRTGWGAALSGSLESIVCLMNFSDFFLRFSF